MGGSSQVKALYRRGLARNHLGLAEEATRDLTLALELDPENKPVKASASYSSATTALLYDVTVYTHSGGAREGQEIDSGRQEEGESGLRQHVLQDLRVRRQRGARCHTVVFSVKHQGMLLGELYLRCRSIELTAPAGVL